MAKSKEFSLKESMDEMKSILFKLENEEIDIDMVPQMVRRAQQLQMLCEEKLTQAENAMNQN